MQALLNCIVFLWAPCNFSVTQHSSNVSATWVILEDNHGRSTSRSSSLGKNSSARRQCPAMLSLSLSSSGRRIRSPWAHSLHRATPVCWCIFISLTHYTNARQVVSLSKPRIKNSTDVFRPTKLETARHYGTLRSTMPDCSGPKLRVY